MFRIALAAVVAIFVTALAATPAAARIRHHHRRAAARAYPPAAYAEAPPRPFMFYPENIEGGVPGNLPFNNQIRKHTDPLNANGGR